MSSDNADVNEQDLGAIADLLETIRDFFSYCLDERIFYKIVDEATGDVDTDPTWVVDRDIIRRGVVASKRILESVITQCRDGTVDEETRQKIKIYNLKADHSKLEQIIFKRIFGKLRDAYSRGIDIKKWLMKAFKAVNIIIDSLKLAFPPLEVTKELKDHFANLTED